MAKVRLNMQISDDLDRWLEEVAEAEGVTKTEIVRRALAALKAYVQQAQVGRRHLGFVRDPRQLECELVGLLNH